MTCTIKGSAFAIVPIRVACWFAACTIASTAVSQTNADELTVTTAAEKSDRTQLHEPVFRVANQPPGLAPVKSESNRSAVVAADVDQAAANPHPLDPALVIARETLKYINENVNDYTCLVVKRERVNGELLPHEFMNCKVRHPRIEDGKKIPFSVYLNFRKPDTMRGREVLFVTGQNEGKVIAHEGGFKGRFLPTVYLSPTSMIAMRGQRYPVTEIGVKNLTVKLIEKGERDKKLGTCKVRILKGAQIKKEVCTCIEVTHPDRLPHLDFHKARIFVHDKLRVPVRYEAYDWPAKGGKPQLLEEYTYMRLKLNVGLTDEDFNEKNEKYNF